LHLVQLELPVEGEEGDCQRELGLDRSGYFVISVKVWSCNALLHMQICTLLERLQIVKCFC